jgi:anthranilate 1,2-dioxygenase large subunit/terephthalate 1,2-dioxygenase oxygenase component alpha subunit
VIVTGSGAHHVSATKRRLPAQDAAFSKEAVPTNKEASYRLADPSLLENVDEFGDGIQLQILSVFPGFVLQQIHNCLAVRQVLPKGVERPNSTGPTSASRTTPRNCAACA